jgi:hypothetical protein
VGLGYLYDLIIAPLGIALALKMIPPDVMERCRAEAHATLDEERPISWAAAVVIIALWLLMGAWVVVVLLRTF